jgi:hypothetical protein
MAQTGFTPIQIYSSSTAAAAPVAGSLTNSTLGSELAINITDGKLFYKDNANAIQVIGWKVVPAVAGGTGQTSYAVGDILYADTTTSLAKLADVATGNALISGGVGVAPAYGKIGLTTHVSGTLPVANGGTNLTSFTANGIIYASSTSALATGSVLTFDGTNFTNTGTTILSGLTASTALALDASKNVISVTNTGTGSNVLATSPSLTTPNLGDATATKINSSEAATGSIANGATATIFTLPQAGSYLVVVRQDGAGNGGIRAAAIVMQGSSTNGTSALFGVSCTLSSGSNFDVNLTNNAGGAAVFRYSYTRLSS